MTGGAVVVEEDDERDLLVVDEGLRVPRVTGSDGHHIGAAGLDLVQVVAQLRGVHAAVDSTEVTDEEDEEGSFDDQVPEADGPAFRVKDAQVRAKKVAHAGQPTPKRYLTSSSDRLAGGRGTPRPYNGLALPRAEIGR